jgi:hypothetical protein
MIFEYILASLIIAVGIIPMVFEYHFKSFDIFNFKNAFILYYIIQLAISGIISISTNKVSNISLDTVVYHNFYTKAFFASLIGIIFFQIGYYTSGKKSFAIPKILPCNWKKFNTKLLVFGFIFLGYSAFFLLLINNGGISQFLIDRESFRAGGLSGQGFLLYPCTQLLAIASFMSLIFIVNKKIGVIEKRSYKIPLFLLLIAIVPPFIIGFRGLIILPMLSFIMIWNYGVKKVNVKKAFPIGILIMMVFTVYGIVREIPLGIKITPTQAYEVITQNPEILYTVVTRSKGTEIVASVIKKLEESKMYDLGYKAIFETGTIFIPHFIWENKPEPGSVRFTTYFFGDDLSFVRGINQDSWGGVSPTIVGESFWHFSWFGVTGILFIFGFLYRKIYQTFITNQKNMSVLLAYALIYPSLIMFPEAIQGYLNGILINIIVLCFLVFLLKIKLTPIISPPKEKKI